MRIPLAVDLHINAFSGATITELESGITNGLAEKMADERLYVTQRPTIDVTEDASVHTAKAKGRGIFYWDSPGALYLVNDDTVFKNSHANSIGTITSGVSKVKMLILDDDLIILDKDNNEGWTVAADTVTQITDTDFPPEKTPAETLCYGGAVMDGYLFVGTAAGLLYNSNNGDATAWTALDVTSAERDPDNGVYVGKQKDHIIFYGTRTTEVFYNAANPTGSPLTRRQDIAYTVGCSDGRSVWEAGDIHFLVGTDSPGAHQVYIFENLTFRKISTPTIDSFITQAIVKDSFLAMGSGFSAHGRLFYILTLYKAPSTITPYISLVYDSRSQLWYIWETTVNGLSKFPLVDWTIRTGVLPRFGEGILSNGDLFTINDDLTASDTLVASKIVEDGIVEPGILEETASATAAVAVSVRTGMKDMGTNSRKFAGSMRYVGDTTPNSQTLTIKWANENNSSFSAGRTIDMSLYERMNRNGSFRRRNFQLETSSTDVVRMEALEIEITAGTH